MSGSDPVSDPVNGAVAVGVAGDGDGDGDDDGDGVNGVVVLLTGEGRERVISVVKMQASGVEFALESAFEAAAVFVKIVASPIVSIISGGSVDNA